MVPHAPRFSNQLSRRGRNTRRPKQKSRLEKSGRGTRKSPPPLSQLLYIVAAVRIT